MSALVTVILYFIRFIATVVVLITNPFFAWIYEDKKNEKLPPVSSALLMRPASELARMIRAREVKVEEVVSIFIDRIKEVNPLTNAVVVNRFNEALQEAKELDNILNSKDIPERYTLENAPFLGVPFTAKEAFGIEGMPNTSGLINSKNKVAACDADAVARLRKAGAIPLGLTNCSELCMWMESNNMLYGQTKNAYHLGRMVGGSSGGEGCILTSAGAAFGVGSDIGGSIRMPAFFNGIFGHKPSYGVVNNVGQYPCAVNEALEFLSTGPMCRYATDLKPMLKAMAEPEQLERLKLDSKVNLSKVKVMYMYDDGGSMLLSPVNPQIKNAIDKVVAHFEGSIGATVTKVSIKKLKHSFDIWAAKMATSGNETFCSLMGNGPEVKPLWELLLWLIQRPRHTLPAIMLGIGEGLTNDDRNQLFRQMCESLKEEFHELLKDDAVFIYPSHPKLAPYHHQALLTPFNFAYTGIFNVLGVPATNVPMGLSKEGLPIGIQVIAHHNNDHLCLAVAEELEREFGGWVPPFPK